MQDIHFVSGKDFIRASNSGMVDLEASKANIKHLCDVWNHSDDHNILIDIRDVVHDLSVPDVRTLFEEVVRSGLGKVNHVAILYRLRKNFDHSKFLEFLAGQKGLNLRAFEEFEEAWAWVAEIKQLETA